MRLPMLKGSDMPNKPSNIRIGYLLLWVVVLTLLIFSCFTVQAQEKTITIPEKDFIQYMQIIEVTTNKLEILSDLTSSQKKSIANLKNQITNHKINIELDVKIFKRQEQALDTLEKHIEYSNKRIKSYREEVLRLETKGSEDRLGKISRITSDTGTGCAIGALFAGVGIVPGCAIGFVSGVLKDFIFNF